MRTLLLSLIRPAALRRPWQTLLAMLGIALGVAVVVGIDLAAAAALTSFRGAVSAVAGNTTHEVTGIAGRVPDELVAALLRHPEVEAATPVLSTAALVPAQNNLPLRLLGIDPFSDFRFRAYSPTNTAGSSLNSPEAVPDAFTRFLTEPNTLVLARPFAVQHGYRAGDSLKLLVGSRPREFTILGIYDPVGPGAESAGDLALCDIATLQEALGLRHGLDRIDLILPGDFAEQERHAAAVRRSLPDGVRLERPAARSAQVEQLIGAFRLNLQALSLLSLFVGIFLIYNTMLFAVVQRRPAIGVVRALGATRQEVLGAFLLESALLGLAGSLLGLLLGTLLAQVAVRLVGQTITDLYAYVRVTEAPLTLLVAAKGLVLGLGAAVIAALWPAREAASTPPRLTLLRSEYEQQARRLLLPLGLAGCGILGLAALSIAIPAGGTPGGFAAAFLVALGFACFTPHLVLGLIAAGRPLVSRLSGTMGVLAIANVGASLSRTGVAIAALMVALAMTIGVTTMISSFRKTVRTWVGGTIIADVYIRPAAQDAAGMDPVLDPDLMAALAATRGVAEISTYRAQEIEIEGRPVFLAAIDADLLDRRAEFTFLDADPHTAWQGAARGEGVLVSEPFARKFNRWRGDSLALPTPSGIREVRILGTFYDYTADRGVVMLDRQVYAGWFNDSAVNSLALFLEPGVSAAEVSAQVRETYGGSWGLVVTSNQELKAEIYRIFDRTFRVTGIMQGLAALVAFVGVLSALMSLLLERTREFGVLRAVGATWSEVARMLTIETGFMGLVASLLAIVCGSILSWILVEVINLRSFGWTIPLSLEGGTFLQAMAIAIGASLLAGVIPAWRLRSLITASAMREE